jgi:endonuclease/exonuclease/phosphatase family metal-dependent hydrolase
MEALRKADADIVVLQEFESAKYLQQLAADSLPEMQYQFFADVPSHGWYMNVVMMSRFPMGIISGYGSATTPLPDYVTEDGSRETQNHINTRMWSIDVFPAENYSFLLTGVHLKAGRGPRNQAMRTGQINLLTATFNRMLDENPGKNMIIAGDLNATPNSAEIGLLLRNDQLRNRFIDAIDTAVYSHPADAPDRRLDYLLVNQNMYAEVVENSVEVAAFFPSDTMRIISDHLPVVGRFYKLDIEQVNTSTDPGGNVGG